MDDGALWAKLILIAILTSINAFFASAEMAMVSVNNNKIKNWQKKETRGQKPFYPYHKIKRDFYPRFKLQ